MPGFDITVLTQGLVEKLYDLDTKMTSYLNQASAIEDDVTVTLDTLIAARMRTDEALDMLGQKWRFRPAP